MKIKEIMIIEQEDYELKGDFLEAVESLEKRGYKPVIFRFMVLRNHYRSSMQFDEAKLREAQTALDFLYSSLHRLKRPQDKIVAAGSSALAEKINQGERDIKKSFFYYKKTPL